MEPYVVSDDHSNPTPLPSLLERQTCHENGKNFSLPILLGPKLNVTARQCSICRAQLNPQAPVNTGNRFLFYQRLSFQGGVPLTSFYQWLSLQSLLTVWLAKWIVRVSRSIWRILCRPLILLAASMPGLRYKGKFDSSEDPAVAQVLKILITLCPLRLSLSFVL